MRLKLRYYFENFIAYKSNFIYFLLLFSAVFALIILVLEFSLGLGEEGSFINLWWLRFQRLLEIDGSSENFNQRIVDSIYWVFNVAFSGTVIGFLAAKIKGFIDDLKKGHSIVIDEGHYLILGWNSTIFTIFEEIRNANENQSKPTIVCYSKMDNIEMRKKIDVEFPNQKNLRILTRSGSLNSVAELRRTNLKKSKVVIILDDLSDSNFSLETLIMAVKMNMSKKPIPIIVQAKTNENISLLNEIFKKQIYAIEKNKIIANVTSQALRNKHISSVVLDFLNYDGDEIYFFSAKNFVGKSYKQVMLMLSSATAIGVRRNNKELLLNPQKDYIIEMEDQLIVIAQDDDMNLEFSNIDNLNNSLNELIIADQPNSKRENLSILVLGWSSLGEQIINNAIPFLDERAKLTYLYDCNYIKSEPSTKNFIGESRFIQYSEKKEEVLKNLILENQYDVILILGYDDNFSSQKSDANALLVNAYVTNLLNTEGLNDIRVILKLTDGSKKELIKDNNFNELIVSDSLSSLIITQLADNQELSGIFEELFSDTGNKISISSINDYGFNYQELDLRVYDLILLSLKRNQNFIGYILDDKLFLNPSKNKKVEINDSLFIVYIA